MVSLTEQLERTAFHDAELWKCKSHDDKLYLYVRNISLALEREQYYSALVTLRGVHQIRRNSAPISELTLEGEGSDVLQFHRGEGTALLLVEWQSYRPLSTTFAKYEIDYDTSEIVFTEQDELIV